MRSSVLRCLLGNDIILWYHVVKVFMGCSVGCGCGVCKGEGYGENNRHSLNFLQKNSKGIYGWIALESFQDSGDDGVSGHSERAQASRGISRD